MCGNMHVCANKNWGATLGSIARDEERIGLSTTLVPVLVPVQQRQVDFYGEGDYCGD